MSKYHPYPEYKNSGVEWIGDIPTDWDMWKIGHVCPYIASGTTPRSDDLNNIYYGGNILWVTTSELREGYIIDTHKKVTKKAVIDFPTLRLHPSGSVAIAMYGATIGRLGILGADATTNQACCVLPPSNILFNKYLFYWLYATRQEIINLSSGGGQPNVNQEKISSLRVSAPGFTLQRKVAKFLDHETAKIDTLIEKQQELIQLLKEKRQAVISHAVTRGLNPNAPMRDSGVEWLGEVPKHWEVKNLNYLVDEQRQIMYGIVLPGPDVDEGVMIVKGGDVKPGRLAPDKLCKTTVSIESNYERSRLLEGDLVYSIRGTIGDVEIVPKCIEGANLTQDAARIAPKFNINNRWLRYALLSTQLFSSLEVGSLGAAVKGVNIRDLKKAKVPVPPKTEMEEIAEYLDWNLEKLDQLRASADRQVTLLRERRTALISSAVTGKIDVRNWQAPENSEQESAA